MADLNAAEVLSRFRELGDNTNPQKQIYKSQVAGRTVELFDLQGRSTLVRAEAIEEYTNKGFAVAPPVPAGRPGRVRNVKTETPPAPADKGEGDKGEGDKGEGDKGEGEGGTS